MRLRRSKPKWRKPYTWNPTEHTAPQSCLRVHRSNAGTLVPLHFSEHSSRREPRCFFHGPSPQGWMPPLCWQLYPHLQNVPEEECCVRWVDLSACRNPAWSPLIIMNCLIVHVVQVIREEKKKSIKISVESIIPSKIIFASIPVVLLFTIRAWKHHSPVGPPGCWQHPPTRLPPRYKGSCLISHLEEKWPRVIDSNRAITGFILTRWGKMQVQEGFLGSSGFSAAQKFRQVSHSSQRILPIRGCY